MICDYLNCVFVLLKQILQPLRLVAPKVMHVARVKAHKQHIRECVLEKCLAFLYRWLPLNDRYIRSSVKMLWEEAKVWRSLFIHCNICTREFV